jgi:putative DNA-invertase from lambdoid prophage Rac
MSRIAYYRVSPMDPSIKSQHEAMRGDAAFDQEFMDLGACGTTPALHRPGFKALMDHCRDGDIVHVLALDRLGKDALDVQATVRQLLAKGVSIHVQGLGLIAKSEGELILAVLLQLADLEKQRIRERAQAGRQAARQSLEATGRTHRGKKSLGRPRSVEPQDVKTWRLASQASLRQTAAHFGVSLATVKRALSA